MNRYLKRCRGLAKCSRTSNRRLAIEKFESRQLLAGDSLALGTNLTSSTDYDVVGFVDVMKQSRDWMTANANLEGQYDTGFEAEILLDADGYPVASVGATAALPFTPAGGGLDQIVHTVIPVHGPGTYRLKASGSGSLLFRADEGLLVNTSDQLESRIITFTNGYDADFEVYDSDFGDGVGRLLLAITTSDAVNPVSDLELISPGHSSTYETAPFLPSMTQHLGTYGNLRFMDWMRANNNPIVDWNDRVTLDTFTQTLPVGVAVEYITALANQVQQDAWITVPARANDAFVTNLATYLRDNLSPGLKVFIEYSNETWNGSFSQATYIQEQGLALVLDWPGYAAGQKFHSMRSAQIWQIFEDTFAAQSADRLVKVLSAQAGVSAVSTERLDALDDPNINPTGIKPDALAINAYFGGEIADDIVRDQELAPTDGSAPITVDQVLDRLEVDLRGPLTSQLTTHKAIASDHDLWLITYEGGQHLVGTGGNVANEDLANLMIAANRSPRMYGIYQEFLTLLEAKDVALHSNFTHISAPNAFGSWGAFESQDQVVSEAHKFRAISDWALGNAPANRVPISRATDEITVVDLDDNGIESVQLDASSSRDFDGKIVSYQWMAGETIIGTTAVVSFDAAVGEQFVTVTVTDDGGASVTGEVRVAVRPAASVGNLVTADLTVAPVTDAGSPDPVWLGTSSIASDVAYSGVTLGPGFTRDTSSSASNLVGFIGTFEGYPGTTLDQAIADGEYLSVTVDTSTSDQWLDLTAASFDFTVERHNWLSPRHYAVMSSVDGFTSSAALFDSERINSQSPTTLSFILPFEGFVTGDPIEFRIYPYGGEYENKETYLNGMSIGGTIIPTPAPTDIQFVGSTLVENTSTVGGDLFVGSLSAIDTTPDDSHTFTLVEGYGDNDKFTIVGNELRLRSGQVIDYETQSSYSTQIRVTDLTMLSLDKSFVVDVTNLVEISKSDVLINDGSTQRSRVESIQIEFDTDVQLQAGAITVSRRETPGSIVGTVIAPLSSATSRVFTISFSGSFVTFGSLIDGNYELSVDASKIVSANGLGLDANQDGVAGDDFIFGNEATDKFFRYYGDIDGDRDVDGSDFLFFRGAYNKSVGNVGYRRAFNFNLDSKVDGSDFLQFRGRYGKTLLF
ncbi:hypothetical protein Poly51_45700 [Rubripirellula tenax]|uniref:PKD/Chitinase domain-containing protein n=1 Tax=Rubripirellula tenax TaxID=2528015 RepID=A0A5C6EMX6_9BACT|nr:hypothetical protein [Rubripirellula tenax]TWU48669.1 hypothetical protein Poly51_45700 [Rubripirellula tenax]